MLADFVTTHVPAPGERLVECRPKRKGAVVDVVPSKVFTGQKTIPCFSKTRDDSDTVSACRSYVKARSHSSFETTEMNQPISECRLACEVSGRGLATPLGETSSVLTNSPTTERPVKWLSQPLLQPSHYSCLSDTFELTPSSCEKTGSSVCRALPIDRRRSGSEHESLKRKLISATTGLVHRKYSKPCDSEAKMENRMWVRAESTGDPSSSMYASLEEALPRSLSVPDLVPSDSSSDESPSSGRAAVQCFLQCQARQHGATLSNTRKRRRTRSLNAPSPIQQFGPCGRILKNQAMVMTIQDPASQRLTWYKPPLTVLVIKKIRDASVLQPFVQLVTWLIKEKRMLVFVEQSVLEDPLLMGNSDFDIVKDKLKTFKDGKDDLTDKIDFIVCLGGDGTLLYASLLFQQSVPPVMAFHLGSLGFLTPFQFDNFQEQVSNVLEGNVALTLRSRLRCVIVRRSEDGNRNSKPPTNLLVLNEVVIDRGPSPYLSNIDLFLDGKHITSVQGDGLIVSTPTGSTAYAVAAGASMIHPSVPAIMVTPICPHSLSFRPIVVPAGVELKISVSPDSRNTSWVSFDGRNRQELLHGDSLRVTTSIYPVPSICAQDQISDWFDSLAECLHWNVRKRQKHLDELSDLTHSSSNDTLNSFDREDHVADT